MLRILYKIIVKPGKISYNNIKHKEADAWKEIIS